MLRAGNVTLPGRLPRSLRPRCSINPQGAAVVQGVLSKVTANNNNTTEIVVDGSFTTGASLNVTVVDSEASNNSSSGVLAFSRPATRPPPSCCAMSLPATTGADLSRTRLPSFGSRIRWSRGIVPESPRPAARYLLRRQRHRWKHLGQHGRSDHARHALTSPPPRRRWPGSGAGADAALFHSPRILT